MMQGNGIRDHQVTQVRGFADQRLRKSDAPLDPSNRRISLIVQYLEKSRRRKPRAAKRRKARAERQPRKKAAKKWERRKAQKAGKRAGKRKSEAGL